MLAALLQRLCCAHLDLWHRRTKRLKCQQGNACHTAGTFVGRQRTGRAMLVQLAQHVGVRLAAQLKPHAYIATRVANGLVPKQVRRVSPPAASNAPHGGTCLLFIHGVAWQWHSVGQARGAAQGATRPVRHRRGRHEQRAARARSRVS